MTMYLEVDDKRVLASESCSSSVPVSHCDGRARVWCTVTTVHACDTQWGQWTYTIHSDESERTCMRCTVTTRHVYGTQWRQCTYRVHSDDNARIGCTVTTMYVHYAHWWQCTCTPQLRAPVFVVRWNAIRKTSTSSSSKRRAARS